MTRFSIRWCGKDALWEKRPLEATTLDLARIEIARSAGDLMRRHAEKLWIDELWQVELVDGDDLVLYSIQITIAETAASISTA